MAAYSSSYHIFLYICMVLQKLFNMKQISLLLLLVLIAWGTQPALAQDVTVTIPEEGTFSTSAYLPTRTWESYSLSQQIYSAAEIGMSGKIKSIAFYNTSTASCNRTLAIYMFETPEAGMNNYTGLTLPPSIQPVFNGLVSIVASDWTTITLDSPFEYDGVSNLCLVVDDNSGGYASTIQWQTFGTNTIQAVYSYGYTNYDPLTQTSFNNYTYAKNRIQLTIGDNPYPKPTQLQVTSMTDDGATISWTNLGGSNVTGWNMQYRGVGADNWETVTGNIESPFTLGNLTLNTNYEIRLKALYGEQESSWATLYFRYEVRFNITVPSGLSSYVEIVSTAASGSEVNVRFKFTKFSNEDVQGLHTLTITPDNAGDPISITHNFPVQSVPGTAFDYSFTMPHANVTLSGEIYHYYEAYIQYYYGDFSYTYDNSFHKHSTYLPAGLPVAITPNQAGQTGCTFVDYQIFVRDYDYNIWGYRYTDITNEVLDGNMLTMPQHVAYIIEHYSKDGNPHTLTIDDEAGYLASINPSTLLIDFGTKVCYTLSEMPDNYIAVITTEEDEIITPTYVDGANPYYCFYMPDEDVTLTIREANIYNITYHELDGNYNIIANHSTTAKEFQEVEVPFADHGIWEYNGYFHVYGPYFNEIFSNNGQGTSFSMPPCDVIVEGEFRPIEDIHILQLSVNDMLRNTLQVEYGQEIELPTPTTGVPEGFSFLGWTTESSYFSTSSIPYELYTDTYTLYDDYATLYALFYQPGDLEYAYNYYYYPADLDTIILAGAYFEDYDPVFFSLTGAGNSVPIDYYWDSDYNPIVYAWIDGDDNYHNASEVAWKVEQVSEEPELFALKQGEQYINIIDGEIALANDYTHGQFAFEENQDQDNMRTIQEVGCNSYLAVTGDNGFTVESTADNSLFSLFMQRHGGTNFTTMVHTYGDGDIVSGFYGYNIVDGHVVLSPNGSAWNEGIINITGNGILDVRGLPFFNSHEDRIIIEDGGQFYFESSEMAATIKKSLTGYGEGDGNWYFLTSPIFDWAPYPTEDLTTGTYDLYQFDETTGFWANTKVQDSIITEFEPVKGYLYANKDDLALEFRGRLTSPFEWLQIPVTYSPATARNVAGFNLIGNPFTFNLDISGIYFSRPTEYEYGYEYIPVQTIYKIEGTQIVAAQNDDAFVKPCEGFFVKATANDAYVEFNNPEDGGYRAVLSDLKIEVTSAKPHAKLLDRAYINFGKARNMEKLMLGKASTRLYITHDGNDYAAISADNEGTMPLSLVVTHDGTYTLTFAAEHTTMEYLHLLDKLTGKDVDLLTNSSYTFDTKCSDEPMHFELKYKVK